MDIRWVFLGVDGRLRSGWRAAIFCIVFVPVVMLLTVAGVGMFGALAIGFEPGTSAAMVTSGMIILIAALLVGWFCGKYLEGLPFRALGAWFTKGWFTHLLAGSFIGAATLGFAVAIAFAFGGLRFEVNQVDSSVLIRSFAVSLVVFAIGAAWEEALFRGYILQTFSRSGLAALAIAMTAIIFGLIHANNPDATFLAVINTMLAGIWFGIAYLKTRDLWFVWGAHLMWNWMQNAFFGIEVSGLTNIVSAPLLREIDSGPTWLTGVTYGIEGGIVTTIALIVSTVAIYFVPWIKPNEFFGRGEGETR